MKRSFLLTFIISFFLLISQAYAENISGFITFDGKGYIFIDSSTQQRFELKPANVSASSDLKKLSNFDSITGKATLMGKGKEYPILLLDSIDFVGLRKLLGMWKSESTILDFIDYNEMSFYFPNEIFKNTKKRTMYRYSVSPKPGESWRVFFSDDNSVVLGSLVIKGQTATIELYDSETGETAKTYSLTKVNP